MNILLFDSNRQNLLPFTYTRPTAEFRCGILTLREKWEKRLASANFSYLTEEYLAIKYGATYSNDNYYVNGTVLANDTLVEQSLRLKQGQILFDQLTDKVIVIRSETQLDPESIKLDDFELVNFTGNYVCIDNIWDIFSKNGAAIQEDFDLLTKGRTSQKLDSTNTHIGERLFIEEGAKVQAAILNSTTGPIYIGKNAEVMELSLIHI